MSKLFQSEKVGNLTLINRIVRSATYEGMCDAHGFPTDEYLEMYTALARNEIGAIITGFVYISPCGRAMHPRQGGIDEDAKIPVYKRMTDRVHSNGGKIIMQIAHCGRQTISKATGEQVKGVSTRRSFYFDSTPRQLTAEEALSLAQRFADAVLRCKRAGFDGVQLHAAHGYLVHQFILPSINNRKDILGIDKERGIGTYFLEVVIDKIREQCGIEFPLLVKISSGDDYGNNFTQEQFVQLIRFLDKKKVEAIEISYGTMDHALSIFRGRTVPLDIILKYTPKYKTGGAIGRFFRKWFLYPFVKPSLKMFTPTYNLSFAKIAKQHTKIPIICVGGFRTKQEMTDAIERNETDFVSLCRPFICEPDFVSKLTANQEYASKCTDCNICAVMCDSANSTRCYLGMIA
ncbi:MAG: NADH:flavin oxidoreductase [Candidatus Omnitrophica bacterium]|nr:NADH:flavin oxidoreductase [Candidatus Omnitrophota bacterium]MBU4467664.1 NADH:flavin oxidoreductase [Candidatus Omnitrophota bacterium]MCG2707488.1 NADH:flavin oxidoreductase [Candidatus Omnitrophota bacterium]